MESRSCRLSATLCTISRHRRRGHCRYFGRRCALDRRHDSLATLRNLGRFRLGLCRFDEWLAPRLRTLFRCGCGLGFAFPALGFFPFLLLAFFAFFLPGFLLGGLLFLEFAEKLRQLAGRGTVLLGPVFLAVNTYRLVGHYIGDPQVYRSKEELQETRETQDPIEHLRAKLELSESEVDDIDREVQEIVDASVEFAKSGTDPKPEDALKNIYA